MPNLRSSASQSSSTIDSHDRVNTTQDNETSLLNRIDGVVQRAVEKAMEKERSRIHDEFEKCEQKLRDLIDQKLGCLHDLEVSVDKKIRQLHDFQKSIDSDREKVSEVTRDLHDLQQYSRRNNIRIFGIPEKPEEDTDALVCGVAEKIGAHITTRDIDRSHRVGRRTPQPTNDTSRDNSYAAVAGSPKDNSPRPIIVKLISYKSKLAFIRNRRLLKGSGVVVAEDLTKMNAKLLSDTFHHEKVCSAWSTDGRIFATIKTTNGREMRKLITSHKTLSNL